MATVPLLIAVSAAHNRETSLEPSRSELIVLLTRAHPFQQYLVHDEADRCHHRVAAFVCFGAALAAAQTGRTEWLLLIWLHGVGSVPRGGRARCGPIAGEQYLSTRLDSQSQLLHARRQWTLIIHRRELRLGDVSGLFAPSDFEILKFF
jgi:hypothetical protein